MARSVATSPIIGQSAGELVLRRLNLWSTYSGALPETLAIIRNDRMEVRCWHCSRIIRKNLPLLWI